LQGACAAVLAPTALSLVAVLFTDRRERARAFATYGAVAGSGAIVGLIVGGALTQYAQWRWCLYVNVLFAVAVLVAGAAPVNASPDWTYCGLTSGCCSAATASPTPGIPWPTPPTTSSRVAPGCHWRFNGLGETLRLTGSIHEGRIQHADAPAVAVEIGNRYEQARAHDGIAIIDHATGDLGQARRHRQQALTLYTELDLPDADHLRAAIEFDATAPLKRC
jgi:hypothetical protein